MKRFGQLALAAVGLVVGVIAVLSLKEATLSTHRKVTEADRTVILEADPRPLGDGRFEASLVPALDETNQRQLRGCLEDWTLDHLKVDVLSVESV